MKETQLQQAIEKYQFSEKRLETMETFVSGQKIRLAEMERKFNENEQVCLNIFYRVNF